MRARSFGNDAAVALLFGAIFWTIMSAPMGHVRAEAARPPPTEPMSAFGLLPPLNSFEQTLLIETLKGVVFALIIALVAFCANRFIERYKIREALFGDYRRKRAEKVIGAWDKITQLDSAWSNLMLETLIVRQASIDPAKGIDDEEFARKLREANENLKSRARPKEVERLERKVADLQTQIVRSIDGERLWLGDKARKELMGGYSRLCKLMDDQKKQEKEREAYFEKASSLPTYDQFRARLEYLKTQPGRIREAASQRAEIEKLRDDLLKILRRHAD